MGGSETAARTIFVLRSGRSALAWLTIFVGRRSESAFACELKGERGSELRVGRDFYVGVGLSGIRCDLEIRAGRASKLHCLGSDRDEMFEWINALGIDVDASGVGQRVDDAETSLAGTKRKKERVLILGVLTFWNRSGVYGLSAGGHGLAVGDFGSVGHVELKVVLIHLRAWRLGGILHGESTLDLQLSLSSLEAHDVGDDFDALNLLADVVDLDFDGRGSRRGHAVIRDFLMDHANEMRARPRRA